MYAPPVGQPSSACFQRPDSSPATAIAQTIGGGCVGGGCVGGGCVGGGCVGGVVAVGLGSGVAVGRAVNVAFTCTAIIVARARAVAVEFVVGVAVGVDEGVGVGDGCAVRVAAMPVAMVLAFAVAVAPVSVVAVAVGVGVAVIEGVGVTSACVWPAVVTVIIAFASAVAVMDVSDSACSSTADAAISVKSGVGDNGAPPPVAGVVGAQPAVIMPNHKSHADSIHRTKNRKACVCVVLLISAPFLKAIHLSTCAAKSNIIVGKGRFQFCATISGTRPKRKTEPATAAQHIAVSLVA